MRYGIKPRNKGLSPDRSLQTAIKKHPDISRFYQIAYPILVVEVDVLEEKLIEITRLEYYILRAVYEGGATTVESIAALLGIEMKFIHDVVKYMVTVDHLLKQQGTTLIISNKGKETLDTNMKSVPGTARRCILLDGATKQPLPIDFYRPTLHTFYKGTQLAKGVTRIIPKDVTPEDLESLTTLTREEKENLGLPVDAVRYLYPSIAYEIVYHLIYIGITSKEQVVIYDSCMSKHREDLQSLTLQDITFIAPKLLETVEEHVMIESLSNSFKLILLAENFEIDSHGRYQIYATRSDFQSQNWEYNMLYKPNMVLRNGAVVYFYPRDEETLKEVILMFVLRKFKVMVNSGEIDRFDLEEVVSEGFESIMSGSGRQLMKPSITLLEFRSYCIDKKENPVLEALIELQEQEEDEEEDFSSIF